MATHGRFHFHDLIEAYSSVTSILETQSTNGGIVGKSKDHHCKSSLFLEIMQSIEKKFNVLEREDNAMIQVTWSSRQPYGSSASNTMYKPVRTTNKEEELVQRVGQALGSG